MIKVKGLYYRYPGNQNDTIKGLDFEVKKGEIFGFLGPSGAGKSTTQKILIGILKNYKGSVTVLDKEIGSIKSDFYENIGVAFEFPNFYTKLTAIENLNFFASFYCKKVANPYALLESVGLASDAKKKVADFSKGMKMRLNFCRALMHDPDILFLDEPTSGLDPVNARILKDIILKKQNEGKIIFLTTHDMHTADELCGRVAFMVDGKIPLIDSPKELKLSKGKKSLKVEYLENSNVQTSEFGLDNIVENSAFIDILRKKEIRTIHTQEASLDKIFIEVTGRRLE
ncbi:MAG TPA: ABC transporter ATP-binding protein [Spirochaetota bacterium]|nr:ABC transporter ATP-binding protein [Spirochaetota bacterium]